MRAFLELITEYLNHPETITSWKDKKGWIIAKIGEFQSYISAHPDEAFAHLKCIPSVIENNVKNGKINKQSLTKIDKFAQLLGTQDAKIFAQNMRNLVDKYSSSSTANKE